MATTLTASTLNVSIEETITLNGVNHGSFNNYSVPSINEVSRRIVSVPTAVKTIAEFDPSTVGPGKFDSDDVRYLRVTNLDNTHYITVGVKSGTDTAYFKVLAGGSFLINDINIDANTGGSAFSAFVRVTGVTAQANTAAVDVELFVASV